MKKFQNSFTYKILNGNITQHIKPLNAVDFFWESGNCETMSDNKIEGLLRKISELEEELTHREVDLAQFREEVQKANSVLEGIIGHLSRDVRLMHELQKVLVPTEIPNIQGFEFSSKFIPSLVSGGDYFDIFEHEDRLRFGVILSSSNGYGVSALMLSILLKLTGRMEARKGAEPPRIMEMIVDELNQSVFQQGGEGESAHIFYSLVDRRSFDVSYCLAGDVVALVQRFSTGELESLEPTMGPIVKGPPPAIVGKTISLNPRDRVILSSPGLVAVQDLNGETFGRERLYEAIALAPRTGVHELRNQILFDVKQFSNGLELKRDITLVVFEVKDRVIKLAKK